MNNKLNILKQYFGHTEFRRGQSELIENILSGRDVLGVMPTGAGKSVCYQVPVKILRVITKKREGRDVMVNRPNASCYIAVRTFG